MKTLSKIAPAASPLDENSLRYVVHSVCTTEANRSLIELYRRWHRCHNATTSQSQLHDRRSLYSAMISQENRTTSVSRTRSVCRPADPERTGHRLAAELDIVTRRSKAASHTRARSATTIRDYKRHLRTCLTWRLQGTIAQLTKVARSVGLVTLGSRP